jgi:hypothetical protein
VVTRVCFAEAWPLAWWWGGPRTAAVSRGEGGEVLVAVRDDDVLDLFRAGDAPTTATAPSETPLTWPPCDVDRVDRSMSKSGTGPEPVERAGLHREPTGIALGSM